jgi:hypothetical protein
MLVFSTGFVLVSCNSWIIALLCMSRLVEKAEKERAGSTRALAVKLKALEALIESKRLSSRQSSSASLHNSMDSD